MSDKSFEGWQRNPEDLQLLFNWVSEMQLQSQQKQAIERLLPIAKGPEEAPAAGVYTCLVQLYLDLGEIEQANEWVNKLNAAEPEGFRTPYFRGIILQKLNRLEEARGYFLEAVKRDRKRADSWKGLVDCCSDTRDFERGLGYIQHARRVPWSPKWRRFWIYKQGCMYQQMANFSLALVSFTEVILDCVANGMPEQVASKPRLSQLPPSALRAALKDAIGLLEAQGLQPFPTAGTLLGWWREGKFLVHDKDVDIMLPVGSDWEKALTTISQASTFDVLPNEMGYTNFRSFVHRETGVVVDLSHHEQGDDDKVQCVWRIPGLPDEQCRRTQQSAYQLVRDQWLGCDFWRPEDPDHFLTEVYGDWRTPMVNFDTVISGCHIVGVPDVARCYAYNRLANLLSSGDREKGLAYVSQLLHKDPLDPVSNHIRNLLAQREDHSGET